MNNIGAWVNSEEILRLNIYFFHWNITKKRNDKNQDIMGKITTSNESCSFSLKISKKGAEDTAINSREEDAGGQWVWGQAGHKPRLFLS